MVSPTMASDDRHLELRRQAEAVCERRTIERDEARAALAHQAEDAEIGRTLRDLMVQLRRLRRYRIPGHVWSPSGVIGSLIDELNELDSEDPDSPEARSEVRDVVCVALQLMDTYNVGLIDGFTRAAAKLDRRLTHIDEGGTWESAKAAERS